MLLQEVEYPVPSGGRVSREEVGYPGGRVSEGRVSRGIGYPGVGYSGVRVYPRNHKSRRYASYLNAFLFDKIFVENCMKMKELGFQFYFENYIFISDFFYTRTCNPHLF